MNDSSKGKTGKANPGTGGTAPRARSVSSQLKDDDQPVVGRIVRVGAIDHQGTPVRVAEATNPKQESYLSQNTVADTQRDDGSDEPLGRIGRSKAAILGTVFLVAGVLGVPLIIYSPVFSKAEKVFWSIVATLYSGTLLYILYRFVVWIFGRI